MSGLLSVDRKSSRVPQALGVVAAAVAVTVVVWALADIVVADLRQPGFDGTAPRELGVAAVAMAALVGALLGWATLLVLERMTSRGRQLWLGLALAVLLLSMGGPFSGEGISSGNRVALALMHLAVAGVVIPGLYRIPQDRPRA